MIELQTPDQAARWLRAHVQGTLQTDSRKVRAGDGFIAWPGAATDGRQYVTSALVQGAAACVVEQVGVDGYPFESERVAAYTGLKAASGPIAAAYYEQPSQQLDVLAVTGTNGKTSTTWWLAQALSALQPAMPCGLVGTLGVGHAPRMGVASNVVNTGLTTPDPVLLQQTFRRFVAEGMTACAIEASSIGIEERRLDGTQIRTAVFTNFTQDHLDYHGSMAAYWQAKAALFDWPGLRAAVVNIDDEKGAELAVQLTGRPLELWTVSCKDAARLRAVDIRFEGQGLCFTVCEGEACHQLATQVVGHYNVANLLGVIAAMRTLGVPLAAAVAACHALHPVPGRMECLGGGEQPLAVVDYAHTPDALAQALLALRPLAEQRGGQLWCVFGCGGDRDPIKRPLMGAMAGQYADQVVLTNDNPRNEKPEAILSQILLGLEGHGAVSVQSDRARAITETVRQAAAHDVVLVAGKGHEDYQETAGLRTPFSDRAEVQRALQARAAAIEGANA
ncbi:MAG: UDP-N-acetylmuramoyl-L-alanyl-D-glutamate--2,6-diaminopimelate ligase [Curvibacter sp. PD_MW3]|nr:MAG: UDP-N-acetylmuramoyl-L-alanyl-D-glutamate--2,6-diaminopimelate ligase [Curvibacter sp. PD_MW3]